MVDSAQNFYCFLNSDLPLKIMENDKKQYIKFQKVSMGKNKLVNAL